MKMIFTKGLATGLIIILVCGSFGSRQEWKPLLDKDLSKWEMYLSYRHKNGYKGEVPLNEKGEEIAPIGYNKNEANVFSVIEENGNPVLKVSGEIYGCVFTRDEYENYHLKLKVKWGSKKWIPRLNEPLDAGILYNSQGKCGVDYWRSWMLSQEFQIMENGFGDYWCIANSQIDIRSEKALGDTLRYTPNGTSRTFGGPGSMGNFCQRSNNYENKNGDWNEVELISIGDKSLHIVNGHVVMALSGSGYIENNKRKPLTKGKVQLQSEAAEVYYKDILIKEMDGMPKQYDQYFN